MTKPLLLNAVTVQETKCSHVKHIISFDGEEYVCDKCTDPGCIVHGLEAQMKAHAPYYAESNPRDNETVDWKGTE